MMCFILLPQLSWDNFPGDRLEIIDWERYFLWYDLFFRQPIIFSTPIIKFSHMIQTHDLWILSDACVLFNNFKNSSNAEILLTILQILYMLSSWDLVFSASSTSLASYWMACCHILFHSLCVNVFSTMYLIWFNFL